MAISLFAAPKENKRQSGPLIGDGLSSRDENISSNSKPPPAWTDRQMYVLATAYKMYPGGTQIWVRVKKEHAALFATKTTGVMSKKYGSMKSLGIVDKILSGDYFGGRDLSRSDEEHRIPIDQRPLFPISSFTGPERSYHIPETLGKPSFHIPKNVNPAAVPLLAAVQGLLNKEFEKMWTGVVDVIVNYFNDNITTAMTSSITSIKSELVYVLTF